MFCWDKEEVLENEHVLPRHTVLRYLWFSENTNTVCNKRAYQPKRSEPSHIFNFIGKVPKINFIFFWKIIYLEFFRNAFQVIFIVHFHWISKNPGNALPGGKGEFSTSQIGPYKIGKSVCKKNRNIYRSLIALLEKIFRSSPFPIPSSRNGWLHVM